MHQSSLNSHKNKGHSPFFFPPIMRSSVGQCRNIRFRQLSASHVIITSEKAPNFSAFHWSPHGSLVSIGQNFVTTRVVHLPKRTETSLITESDQSGPNHQLLQLCTVRTTWSESDQAVRAVHSCISWFTSFFLSCLCASFLV